MEYLGYVITEDVRGWHCNALGLYRYASEDALMLAMRRKLARQGNRGYSKREHAYA